MQSDTAPDARLAQIAAWRRLGPAGRVELAWEMSESAREIAIDGMLAHDSALTREEARLRLLRRLLGAALYEAAYPDRQPAP